ncbi:hypothetical protein QE152_g39306 [Popillia japonica]|uniref:Uncharacterized protein n=1 Tax=Popillia japonica TaxID=7064 RepID=A0AAW1HTY1_POPJA
MEDYTGSDHQYITFAINENPETCRRQQRPTYWWTQEIADLRRECLRLRRAAQRHRNGNEAETIAIIADLRRECLRLRRAAQRHRNGNEAETIAIEHIERQRGNCDGL